MAAARLASAATFTTLGGLVASNSDPIIAMLKSANLASVLKPTADTVAAATVANAELQAAALASLVKSLEAVVQQQQRMIAGGGGSSVGTVVKLALPVGCGLAVLHYLGYEWAKLGWATPQQLQQGLAAVRAAIGTACAQLSEEMHARFLAVEEALADMGKRVTEVKDELKSEVQTVGASVAALDERMLPMESDVHRTAQGVDLLCEVVAGLSPNAPPDLRRRLDSFTSSEVSRRIANGSSSSAAAEAAPGLVSSASSSSMPELLGPPPAAPSLSAPAGGGGFLNALLGPDALQSPLRKEVPSM